MSFKNIPVLLEIGNGQPCSISASNLILTSTYHPKHKYIKVKHQIASFCTLVMPKMESNLPPLVASGRRTDWHDGTRKFAGKVYNV